MGLSMAEIDGATFELLDAISRRSYAFDLFVSEISRNELIKGGVLATLLWWCWGQQEQKRDGLPVVRVVLGVLLAVAAGRVLQMTLPYRLRPMHAEPPELSLPYGVDPSGLIGWSSFPSDHAVLFFAVAAGIWHLHRTAGIVAFVWTAVIICLPRVYMGLHYMTDILAGMAVGIAIMAVCLRVPLPDKVHRLAGTLQYRYGGLMYAAAFLVTLQIATLFHDARLFAGSLAELLH